MYLLANLFNIAEPFCFAPHKVLFKGIPKCIPKCIPTKRKPKAKVKAKRAQRK